MEISSLWRHFRPCSKRQYFPLLESSVDCRIYPNLPYLCISYSPWQYWSTYYIPLPQQLASFAWYFHIVEGISKSQTLEYRFGRYLPVFLLTFIRYCRAVWPLTKYIVDNFSSIILHSNDFYANVQILLHSFLMNSLRDDDYIALQQPVQGYLCSSLAVFLAYLGEGRVGSGSTW